MVCIIDSGGYSQENLQTWQQMAWVTRVPETIKQAKELISLVATEDMVELEKGYRLSLIGTYGNIKQRWLLVYSKQAAGARGKTATPSHR